MKGDWEGWLKFFLKGVIEVSQEAAKTAKEIIELKEKLIKKLIKKRIASNYGVGLIELIFSLPIVSSMDVQDKLSIRSKETVNKLLKKFLLVLAGRPFGEE